MATSEASMKSLYAGLYRTIIRFGLLIAAAWLFGAFSFYLSRKLHLEPPKSYVRLLYFGYLTGIIGTGIWGYGDLLVGLTL
jgi:hypothetical protein